MTQIFLVDSVLYMCELLGELRFVFESSFGSGFAFGNSFGIGIGNVSFGFSFGNLFAFG